MTTGRSMVDCFICGRRGSQFVARNGRGHSESPAVIGLGVESVTTTQHLHGCDVHRAILGALVPHQGAHTVQARTLVVYVADGLVGKNQRLVPRLDHFVTQQVVHDVQAYRLAVPAKFNSRSVNTRVVLRMHTCEPMAYLPAPMKNANICSLTSPVTP